MFLLLKVSSRSTNGIAVCAANDHEVFLGTWHFSRTQYNTAELTVVLHLPSYYAPIRRPQASLVPGNAGPQGIPLLRC